MTVDEIIELATKAGIFPRSDTQIMLQRFAKLIAAKEREACAKVCEEGKFMTFGCAAEAIRARGQA